MRAILALSLPLDINTCHCLKKVLHLANQRKRSGDCSTAPSYKMIIRGGIFDLAVVNPRVVVLLCCLLSSYIFSLIYYWKILRTQTKWIKYLYVTTVANIFLFACFPVSDVALVYTPIIFTFFLVKWCPMGRWTAAANFAFVYGLLLAGHWYRRYEPGIYAFNVVDTLMMLIIKLTSFAFDMQDASRDGTDAGGCRADQASLDEKSTRNAKRVIMAQYPTFLEFLGYALFFPGLLLGPTISFWEYKRFNEGGYSAEIKTIPGALPARKRRVMYLFAMSALLGGIFFGLRLSFPDLFVFEAEFATKPLWYKFLYLHICNFLRRSRFYFDWMASEGSYVAIGMGLRRGRRGEPVWDQIENVNPVKLERFTDFKVFTKEWNVCTNQWLRHYVYERIKGYYGAVGSSAAAIMVTHAIAGMWHGFYPGIFLTAITGAWMTVVAKSRLYLFWNVLLTI